MFRARPIRSNTLKPLPRFGVNVGDWKYIIIISVVCYGTPFLLNLWVWVIPLGAFTGSLAAVGSVAFFNWTQKGKKPLWFNYWIKAIWERWGRWRRALPGDYSDTSWLKS